MAKAPSGYYTILDFMTMNDFQRQLALAEYRNLVESGAMGIAQALQDPGVAVESVKKKAKRKKSAYSRALSKELKAINKQARTKSGKLRKGMTQKKILAKAHRAVKRRLK